MPQTNSNIELIQGDITTAEVDAIVNAANTRMLGGGGVDGAIHRAAGPQLLEECRKIAPDAHGRRCPTGEARITPAGNLKAKFVIHTVGPRYNSNANPAQLLESAYRNSLQLALRNNCKSIAFPAISCGIYGYPLHEAALIAKKVCSDKAFHTLKIYFYLFDAKTLRIWSQIFNSV
jgi:O-acetyl-ADP-ribose deacetylase (regulator of RNase III)